MEVFVQTRHCIESGARGNANAMLRHPCSPCEYLIKFRPIINCYLGEINVTRLGRDAVLVDLTINSLRGIKVWPNTFDCVHPHDCLDEYRLNIDVLARVKQTREKA